MLKQLNRDQLDGLAKLCFDLAKGALGVSLLPPVATLAESPLMIVLKIIIGLSMGIAFTYAALVILKIKEKIQ